MSDQGYLDFVQRFNEVCGKYADKNAITYMRNAADCGGDGSDTLFSFGEIAQHVKAAKEQFAAVGLRPGDRAAIISPHSPFAAIAGLSLAYANITSVLIDASLPGAEINRLLEFSDVRAVFTVPSTYAALDKTLTVGIPVFDLSNEEEGYRVFDGSVYVVSKETAERERERDAGFDVIAILFSSGTTASVKGIMTTYAAVNESRPMYNELSGLSDIDTDLLTLPFCHVAGFFCFYQFFMCGCGLGFIENMDASKISAGFQAYKPSFFAFAPKFYEIVEQRIRQNIRAKGKAVETVLLAMLGLSRFLRKSFGINIGKPLFKSIRSRVFGENIKLLGSGASVCKESTARFFLDLGIEGFANFYSLTETYVPMVATGMFDRYPAGTEGRVDRFDCINIKIHEPDTDGIGEIRVKTALIMKGYFRDPDATAEAFDEDGYFKTGDLGYIDRKKYLHVTGRIKESIHMHTGKKVAPSDVDAFYSAVCPGAVIASCGVPDRNGIFDEIHIFVESGELSEDERHGMERAIMEHSQQSGTLYQIAGVHFIDKLPVTSVGKVKRFKLKEIAQNLALRDDMNRELRIANREGEK